MAGATGIAASTLQSCLNEEGWPESLRQYRKDFQEIRRNTVAFRKKLLAAALENCDPQMVYAAVRLENVAAAREHAKSTFFTFGLPVHDISYNLRHFILIVTGSNDQTTGFTLPIRLEFEESPRLLFGNLRGRKTTAYDTVFSGIISRFDPDIISLIPSPSHLKQSSSLFQFMSRELTGLPTVILGIENGKTHELISLLKLGVADFVTAPLESIDVLPRIWQLLKQKRCDETVKRIVQGGAALKQLIGESPCFLAELNKIPFVAKYDASVLIGGETGTGKEFSSEALQKLMLYDWPGNVRELEHIVEQAVVLSKEEAIRGADITLPQIGKTEPQESFREAKYKFITQFEKAYIKKLLLAHQGNITKAAKAAHKNRRAFWELIRKHDINVRNFKPNSVEKYG